MELASKYDPKEVEGKWYQYWLDHKLFSGSHAEQYDSGYPGAPCPYGG